MLHIVLLILKIIGALLLGLIILLLILAAAVILAPLSYRGELSADNSAESIKGMLRFHWLFYLLEGYVSYSNGKFKWQIRAGWKKFGSGVNSASVSTFPQERSETRKSTPKPVLQPDNQTDSAVQPAGPEQKMSEENSGIGHIPEKPAQNNRTEKRELPKPERQSSPAEENFSLKISRIRERFEKFKEKIKYTFRKLCDKIKALKKKKERIVSFLENTTHKNAFSRLIKELRRFLHFLRPSKASVDLEFGFSDPAYTGYTLAWISLIYPTIGEFTKLKPDFEHRVFRGSIFLKGKFRILYALIFAWNMLWDKNVRITYRHIRKFRL